ncbi:MAG TPA: heparinase II/III family protein [Streptosporangiaceae bacterium]
MSMPSRAAVARGVRATGAIRAVGACLAAGVVAATGCGGPDGRTAPVPTISTTRATRTAPATSGEPRQAPGALTAADHARACGRPQPFPAGTADEIMAGRLTIPPFRPVRIDPRRRGDPDWTLDPYHHPTWTTAYRSGGWIEALVAAYLAERDRPGAHRTPPEAYRARAAALLRSWLRHVPTKERKPFTLVCAARIFAGQPWIERQIAPLVDYVAGHWQGPWNHGLRQDLDLLQIACGYPQDAWGGRPHRWRAAARRQLVAAFDPGRLGPAIDRQGAVNEQSTGYTKYDYGWWTTADRRLVACGAALPGWIRGRVARLPTFLAHATQPDGTLVQIGDTYQEPSGTVPGSPPPPPVAVYDAGYVFGRSGWGTAERAGTESYYSLRFGRGRQVHGHNDHMSLTYFARGRDLIVDSGHVGYEKSPYRTFLRSPDAHNVLTMPGLPFSPRAPTRLTRRSIGRDGQFFAFSDTAYAGRRRDRAVYVSQRPDFVAVLDRAAGGGRVRQLWHLDPALRITAVHRTYAVAGAPGTRLQIRQVPLPGQRIPRGSTGVVRGRTHPYQGWVSRSMRSRTPAPVVTMTRKGASAAAILTLITPTAPGTAVSATATRRPDGGFRLDIRIGGDTTSLLVSADGAMTRP